MRFLKWFTITLVSLFIIFVVAYGARLSIINTVVQLNLLPVKITCLDISLSTDMAISFDKLCIENPQVDIDVADLVIHWQVFTESNTTVGVTLHNIINITDVEAGLIEVTGKKHLFSNNNTPLASNESTQNNQSVDQLLLTYLDHAQQVQTFLSPVKVNIAQLSYLPFTPDNHIKNIEKPPYLVEMSASDDSLLFALTHHDNTEIINAKLSQEEKGLSLSLSTQLKALKSFAGAHRLPITKTLQNDFNKADISGSIDSLITYQAGLLTMENKITDFSIIADDSIDKKGFDKSGVVKLSGAVNVNSQFMLPTHKVNNKQLNNMDTEISLQFIDTNEVLVEYNHTYLYQWLKDNAASPVLISILQDNPSSQLVLKPKGAVTLVLDNKKAQVREVSISHINTSVNNHDEQLHKMTVDNLYADLTTTNTLDTLIVEAFVLDTQLYLHSAVNVPSLSSSPVMFHVVGSLQRTEEITTVNLTKKTRISLEDIILAGDEKKGENPLFSLSALTTDLTGNVQLLKDNSLNINLAMHNQASQFNVPNTLKINMFDVISEIKGNLGNIDINTKVNADGLSLGHVTIKGSVESPQIAMAANDIPLTDLLALKLPLPVAVELIEGKLTYSIAGHLADLSGINATQFNGAIAISSLSGEIEGVWLEALNWQQKFILQSGNITTQASEKDNLTIELIELFSPVSKFSVSTAWSFNNNNVSFSANNLKADAFGGDFLLQNIEWPFKAGHSANVQLNNIDLEQVLALDKKQGIVVTGNISGQLPIMFDGEKFIMESGKLYNVSNGLIQVIDNPAVAELRANNSQLQLAFDALQNLHYHQLSSAVSMADDGYMLLDTIIKGRNPDINNDVNLNLNLTYDLLGLLESLSITQHFENNIIKGLQRNKE